MWVSKIATCFLVPAWAMASMVATNALVPASALHHRSSSKHYHPTTPVTTVPSRTTSVLKSVENPDDSNSQEDEPSSVSKKSAEESIPRGGGINVADDKPPALPTLADYRKFAIPCLGLWVAQPLLSLVDTAFVGLSAGSKSAAQLASLGPATTFFDGATYLFAFLNVATTNLYSTARAQKGEQSDQAEAVVRTDGGFFVPGNSGCPRCCRPVKHCMVVLPLRGQQDVLAADFQRSLERCPPFGVEMRRCGCR